MCRRHSLSYLPHAKSKTQPDKGHAQNRLRTFRLLHRQTLVHTATRVQAGMKTSVYKAVSACVKISGMPHTLRTRHQKSDIDAMWGCLHGCEQMESICL